MLLGPTPLTIIAMSTKNGHLREPAALFLRPRERTGVVAHTGALLDALHRRVKQALHARAGGLFDQAGGLVVGQPRRRLCLLHAHQELLVGLRGRRCVRVCGWWWWRRW